MHVPCEGCGRTYEEARFEGGRTIWCTCGRRVGLRLEPAWRDAAGPPRFIADAMLGRLARWLRLLGFDCAWDPEISDEALVRRGLEEERLVLTLDRALGDDWWVSTIHVIETRAWPEQLAEVVRRFDLARAIDLFARCGDCNLPLERVAAERVAGRVPADVLERGLELHLCAGCGRVFWEGSHTERMRAFVDEVLDED